MKQTATLSSTCVSDERRLDESNAKYASWSEMPHALRILSSMLMPLAVPVFGTFSGVGGRGGGTGPLAGVLEPAPVAAVFGPGSLLSPPQPVTAPSDASEPAARAARANDSATE